ncbi:hypothetical protein JNJ66_01520 [Candidatus Saccharibacteria bacterium]|nr:hypothetical protein [Candidatus Saccharibacteria bacterium]
MDYNLCRFPACNRPWTIEAEAEDGFCAFVCDEHFQILPENDPIHGQAVRVSSMTVDFPDVNKAATASGKISTTKSKHISNLKSY